MPGWPGDVEKPVAEHPVDLAELENMLGESGGADGAQVELAVDAVRLRCRGGRGPDPGAPVHDARALTRGGREAEIRLGDRVYTLRITRAGKLILT